MERVVAVRVFRPYVLELAFDDVTRRQVDREPDLWGEVFEPLRDPSFFAQVAVDEELGTIVWPNGADFSPGLLDFGEEGPPPGYYDRPDITADGGQASLTAGRRHRQPN